MERKKSKIEKLRGEIALQPEISFVLSAILEKQGEIIDYLNSQDKEEELTDKKKAIDKGVDRKDTPEEWEKIRNDGALAFYIELEDWLFESGYVKDGEIKVPTKVFMRFIAKELKLNKKK